MLVERYRVEELALGFCDEGAGGQGEVAKVGLAEVGCDRTDRFLWKFTHLRRSGEGSNLTEDCGRLISPSPHHSGLSKPRGRCCTGRHWKLRWPALRILTT